MSRRDGGPARLIASEGSERILSKAECDAIAQRVFNLARGGGETRVRIHSWWNGELRWARNRVSLASDRRDIRLVVQRTVGIGRGEVTTNQLDDVSLEAAVRAAERNAELAPMTLHQPKGIPPAPV